MKGMIKLGLILLLLTYGVQSQYNVQKEKKDLDVDRLSKGSLDYSTVKDGLFIPDNIAIHVIQNIVNFAGSTTIWLVLLFLYFEKPDEQRNHERNILILNSESIKKGLFQHDNIIIHIGQNFMDTLGNVMFWIYVAYEYKKPLDQRYTNAKWIKRVRPHLKPRDRKLLDSMLHEEQSFAKKFDSEAVLVGTFDPNNIAVHVGQNFIDFGGGAVLWVALAQHYQEPKGRKPLARTADFDYEAIHKGLFDPNNIVIHVVQNFVDLMGGTLFWILLGSQYRKPPSAEKLASRKIDNLNAKTVYTGLFEPNLVLVHVGQNFYDVFGASPLWTFLGSQYQRPVDSRSASLVALDYKTIYNGLYDPNNIIIHLGQNFLDRFANTVAAWFFLAALYEKPTDDNENRLWTVGNEQALLP